LCLFSHIFSCPIFPASSTLSLFLPHRYHTFSISSAGFNDLVSFCLLLCPFPPTFSILLCFAFLSQHRVFPLVSFWLLLCTRYATLFLCDTIPSATLVSFCFSHNTIPSFLFI
jgi:hypothetical protein